MSARQGKRKPKRLSTKRKMNLMYKNVSQHKRFRRLRGLAKFAFAISLIVAVVCLFLIVLAFLWPVIYILLALMTLGLILLSDWSMDIAPFVQGVIPVATTALILAGIFFALSFALDYLGHFAQVRELRKNPEENQHYLKIAGVALKVKILEAIRIVALAVIIGVAIIVAQGTGFDKDSALSTVLAVFALLVIFGLPIVYYFYTRKQFDKIDDSVQAVLAAKS